LKSLCYDARSEKHQIVKCTFKYSMVDGTAYRAYTCTVRKAVAYPYFHHEDGGSSFFRNVCDHQ